MMAARNKKGQFEKGSSGNEYGRPKTEKPNHRLPARNRNSIFRIAEMERGVVIDGERQTMTLFEAATMRLAIAAANGDRVSARQFVQLVSDAAREDLSMRLKTKLLMADMDAVRDQNEMLKEKLGSRTGGVIHDPNHDWSWTGISDEARLDDGRTSLEDGPPNT